MAEKPQMTTKRETDRTPLSNINTMGQGLGKKKKWKCSLLSRLTLSDPMNYSPSGSSVYGILQERILELVAILFSRRSSQLMDQICKHILYHLSHQGTLIPKQNKRCNKKIDNEVYPLPNFKMFNICLKLGKKSFKYNANWSLCFFLFLFFLILFYF